MIQKSRGPTRSPCKKDRTKQLKVFLRWHGPHQVLRVEAALPLSQKGSPDFVTHHKHLREFCQGLVFIRKKRYDSTRYGEPLWLRGNNRFRPDEPDVGNANVGRMQHSCTKRGAPFSGAPVFCFAFFGGFVYESSAAAAAPVRCDRPHLAERPPPCRCSGPGH